MIADRDKHWAVSTAVAPPTTLGDLIKTARENKGLTQKALGDLLEMGQPAVCGWERNRARPNARTLAELATVLDLDLGDLTRAAGNPLEYPRGTTPDN